MSDRDAAPANWVHSKNHSHIVRTGQKKACPRGEFNRNDISITHLFQVRFKCCSMLSQCCATRDLSVSVPLQPALILKANLECGIYFLILKIKCAGGAVFAMLGGRISLSRQLSALFCKQTTNCFGFLCKTRDEPINKKKIHRAIL